MSSPAAEFILQVETNWRTRLGGDASLVELIQGLEGQMARFAARFMDRARRRAFSIGSGGGLAGF